LKVSRLIGKLGNPLFLSWTVAFNCGKILAPSLLMLKILKTWGPPITYMI